MEHVPHPVLQPLIKPIVEPVAKEMSTLGSTLGAGIGNWVKGLFASANGNVFNSPDLAAYSNQIVTRPTLFQFASGMGLMAEAGPEAILPLRRGADGKLGVDGGGSNVYVKVINNVPGAQAVARERTEGGVRIVEVIVDRVESAIWANVARGSGPGAATLQDTYGLNRVAGSY